MYHDDNLNLTDSSCQDGETAFYLSLLAGVDELVSTLTKMRETIEHELVLKRYFG